MFVYYSLMDTESSCKSKVRKRKAALNVSFCVKKERNTVYQKVSTILQKPLAERSKDEAELLNNSKDVVQQIALRKAQRQKVKDRVLEYEDPVHVLAEKCKALAEAVMKSNHLVVYTGAGISTAACIPDYRGKNGIWTLLQQGKDIGLHDLSQAEPTLTHMALYCLYRSGILKHVVSQNCDGLHLRSGIPRTVLSEVHGNMYLEVCSKCKPSNHYLRLFDVTEYTARYSHETLRLCYKCGSPLLDTIVHFGERGKLQWPLNWETACKQADEADVILCLGSSLKVLKKYPWLWCMDKPVKKRPKLYIVNLQWTPKDDQSTLKINGKCDIVIEQMMSHLQLTIPQYVRDLDPIFYHATLLNEFETHTTSRSPIEKVPLLSSSSQISQENEMEVKQECKSQSNRIGKSISLMCSSTQDLSLNIKNKISSDDDGEYSGERESDLSSTNNLILADSINIKEEIIDSSDKENDALLCANDDIRSKKPSKDNISEIKNARIGDNLEGNMKYDGQSALSVINEKSVDMTVSEMVLEKTERTVEISSESSTKCHLIESGFNQPTSSQVSNLAILPYFNNTAAEWCMSGMNLLYGRSLWSDLSLFDALTHQPILFGHPVLQWSDLNTYSSLVPYYSNNFASAQSSYFDKSRNANISETALCSGSSGSGTSSSLKTTCSEVEKPSTEEVTCLFCSQYYYSKTCLFYTLCSTTVPFDSNSVCLCCGGDEEEDQDEQEEDGDKLAAKVPNINPGWFGKGCRKKIKKRK